MNKCECCISPDKVDKKVCAICIERSVVCSKCGVRVMLFEEHNNITCDPNQSKNS